MILDKLYNDYGNYRWGKGEYFLFGVDKKDVIVFDVETTGLPVYPSSKSFLENEILQLAIIDGTGGLHLNELFSPSRKMSWPEAEAIHGITPENVKGKPKIETFVPAIQDIVDSAKLLVAYNAQFDLYFLRNVDISFTGKWCIDVMKEFTRKHLKNKYSSAKSHISLKKCAAYYGYELERVHDAEADARATLHCFLKMQEDNV